MVNQAEQENSLLWCRNYCTTHRKTFRQEHSLRCFSKALRWLKFFFCEHHLSSIKGGKQTNRKMSKGQERENCREISPCMLFKFQTFDVDILHFENLCVYVVFDTFYITTIDGCEKEENNKNGIPSCKLLMISNITHLHFLYMSANLMQHPATYIQCNVLYTND